MQLKVGKQRNEKYNSIDNYCYSEMCNSNGEAMLNFTENNSLKIANTFFKKRRNRKWTRQLPDNLTRNEIDWFVIDDLHIVSDVSRYDSFGFISDDRAILMKIEIPKRIRISKF